MRLLGIENALGFRNGGIKLRAVTFAKDVLPVKGFLKQVLQGCAQLFFHVDLLVVEQPFSPAVLAVSTPG